MIFGLQVITSLKNAQDKTVVAMDHQQEVAYALSNGTKINDLGWLWTAIMHSTSSIIQMFPEHVNENTHIISSKNVVQFLAM